MATKAAKASSKSKHVRLVDSKPATLAVVSAILEDWSNFGDEEISARREDRPLDVRRPGHFYAGDTSSGSKRRPKSATPREGLSTLFAASDSLARTPLGTYINHWMNRTGYSNLVFVAALIYIDRLVGKCSSVDVTTNNIHKLFAVSAFVASKVLGDHVLKTTRAQKIAGVADDELERLEAEFMGLLRFDISIGDEEFLSAEAFFVAEAVLCASSRLSVRDCLRGENVERYYNRRR